METLAQRLARPDVASLPDWAAAAALNQPDPTLPAVETWEPTKIGIGAILDTLGPSAGARFLDALETLAETTPVVRWGLELIRGPGLDLSRPSARSQLEVLVAGRILQPAEGEALLALSRRTRHPSWAEANGVVVDARAVGLARGGR
jgi:hypothetical protein